MCSLIVNYTDPYDDRMARAVWARYSKNHPNHLGCKFGSKCAQIDCFVNTTKGIFAVELACNSCWTTTMSYPEEYIHIPVRKLGYFKKWLTGIGADGKEASVVMCSRGYFVLFNTKYTRAAVLRFCDILQGNYTFKMLQLNGRNCKVVLIPKTLIVKYIEIL